MGISPPPSTDEVVENIESEVEQFSTPSKNGEKVVSKRNKAPPKPMDLEVPAASDNTAAPVQVSSLLY